MLCPNCGAQNPDGSLTCERCGATLGDVPAGASLTWQEEDGVIRTVPLYRTITVGRVQGNDIVLVDSALSRQHARFDVTPEGIWLSDLGSLNGVFLNDQRVGEPCPLQLGDVVRLGRTSMTVVLAAGATEPIPIPSSAVEVAEAEHTVMLGSGPGLESKTMLAAPEPVADDKTMLAPSAIEELPAAVEPARPAGYLVAGDLRVAVYDTVTVGRSEGNDIHMADDRVMSRNHGSVERRPDGVWVVDNQSANGTYVNNVRIVDPVLIKDGDEVRFGNTAFRYEADVPPPPVAPVAPAATPEAGLIGVKAVDSSATLLAVPDLQDQTLQGTDADLYIREAALVELQALRAGETEAAPRGSPPLDKYHLVVNFGPEAGRFFVLDKDVLVLGRAAKDADYDIQLDDRAISRPHAKIVRGPSGFTVQDLESANGTWLNYTEELTAPHVLGDGDIIKIGKTTLVFRVPASVRPAEPAAQLDPTLGQIITLFSLKGGVGTTAVAVNLALLLKRITGQSVLLVDLSTERGAVTVHLNLAPKLTLADLPTDPQLIDQDSLHTIIAHHSSGVDVLPAPPSPQTAELVTPASIAAVLPLVRSMYKWIVVDTSPTFSELNLGVFDVSDLMLLTFAPDVASLKVIQSTLDVMAVLQTPAEKRLLVLNETHTRSHLRQEDLEATLGERIALHLPHAGDAVLDSIDRGVPLADSNRDHAFLQPIEDLTKRLAQVQVQSVEQPQRRGRFGQWVQGVLGGLRR